MKTYLIEHDDFVGLLERYFPILPVCGPECILANAHIHEGELDHLLGLTWKQVLISAPALVRSGDVYLLPDKAIRYYLPAYLAMCIDRPGSDMLAESLVRAMARDDCAVLRIGFDRDQLKWILEGVIQIIRQRLCFDVVETERVRHFLESQLQPKNEL